MEISYTKVGTVGKSFGVKGYNRIKIFDDYFDTVIEQKFVFLEVDNYHVPYRINEWRSSNQEVKFDDISDQVSADKLNALSVYLPSELLKNDDEQLSVGFIGYTIFDLENEIGLITDIMDLKEQILAQVQYQEKEVYIPIHESLIVDLKMDEKILVMNLPDGLLDL